MITRMVRRLMIISRVRRMLIMLLSICRRLRLRVSFRSLLIGLILECFLFRVIIRINFVRCLILGCLLRRSICYSEDNLLDGFL